MNRREDGDQSRFAAEEPLFESAQRSSGLRELESLDPEMVALKKKKKMFIIGGLSFVALLFLLLLLPSGSKKIAAPKATPTTSTSQTAEKTRLEQRLDVVRSDFRQADPSKQPLLFPPLNYKLDIATNESRQ